MTQIKDSSIQLYLDTLASKDATPGGGSASALMGAQSAALTSMVCNLTIGKPKYAEVEKLNKAYQADAILLTEDIKNKREAEIASIEKEVIQSHSSATSVTLLRYSLWSSSLFIFIFCFFDFFV
jgi:formiminotetrahydrofolate cyclodeaminase